MRLDGANRGGLALGTLFAAMHAIWVVLFWAGAGRTVLDTLLGAHFVAAQYGTVAVTAGTAILGIVGAFVSGYVLGFVTLLLWNLFE